MPTEHGDREEAEHGEILRATVGSELHGVALDDGNSDHDEMGVYIQKPENVLGFGNPRDDYVYRSKAEGERSGHGDTDFISYSLAKYLRLASNGNPTSLLPLFAPDDKLLSCNEYGRELRSMRSHFLSVHAVHRFLGYQRHQLERIEGQSRRHVPNRPELIEKYGWDTKYGSHALRLSFQGLEIAQFGTLTLPMKDIERDMVLAVKRGEWTQKETLDVCRDLAVEIQEVLDAGCALPAEPNRELLTVWAVDAQRNFWGWA